MDDLQVKTEKEHDAKGGGIIQPGGKIAIEKDGVPQNHPDRQDRMGCPAFIDKKTEQAEQAATGQPRGGGDSIEFNDPNN